MRTIKFRYPKSTSGLRGRSKSLGGDHDGWGDAGSYSGLRASRHSKNDINSAGLESFSGSLSKKWSYGNGSK